MRRGLFMVDYEKIKEKIKEMDRAFTQQAQIELRLNYILKDFETQLNSLTQNSAVLDYLLENIKELMNDKN